MDAKGSRIAGLFGFESHSYVPATTDEVHRLRPGFVFPASASASVLLGVVVPPPVAYALVNVT